MQGHTLFKLKLLILIDYNCISGRFKCRVSMIFLQTILRCRGAVCIFFLLMKTFSSKLYGYFTNRINQFSRRVSTAFSFVSNILTKKLPIVLDFNSQTNNSIFISVRGLTADTCHVNGTKHLLDVYILLIAILHSLHDYGLLLWE